MKRPQLLHPAIGRTPRAVACSAVRQLLYSVESGGRSMPDALERHRASCLSCQTETIRQRQVLRGLVDLSEIIELMPYDVSSELDPGFTSVVGEDGIDDLLGRRRPSRAAIASAASLAAIGAVVIAGRRIRSIAS